MPTQTTVTKEVSSTVPRVSISCPTTYTASIFEDIKNYSEAGATGIGLWEYKFTTGQPGEYGLEQARRIVTEKLKPAADAAGELGIVLGVEPYRQTSGTLVTTLPEVLEMIDAVGRPNVKVIVDVWHYWDIPGGLGDLAAHADRVVGVQMNDWREPTRGWCDRVLPGDGSIDLRAILRTLGGRGGPGQRREIHVPVEHEERRRLKSWAIDLTKERRWPHSAQCQWTGRNASTGSGSGSTASPGRRRQWSGMS